MLKASTSKETNQIENLNDNTEDLLKQGKGARDEIKNIVN